MKKSLLFRSSASALVAGFMLAAGAANAETADVVIDGNGSKGYIITNAVPSGGSNPNVNNSADVSVGSSAGQTVYTNFATAGGNGSGGGAGLGGVFFVDDGRTLTLTNVSMLNNTARGGKGGVGDVGGSMNGLVSPATAAAGSNGANSEVGFANFDGGKGGPGYAGSNGADATLGVGGTGGLGGHGSNGTPVTADTVLQSLYLAYDAVKLAKTIKDGSDYTAIATEMTALAAAAAAGANAGGPTTVALAPLFTTLATQFTAMAAAEMADASEEAKRLAADTAYNIAMTITAYQVGAAGVGGDGGSGGTGGDGSRFFSGGQGGAGGYGGFAVGTSGAVGGGGGSGGDAGFSGFGAGGASGGVGGAGGDSGSAGGVGGAYLNGDNGGGGTAGFGGGEGSTRGDYYGSSLGGYNYFGGGGGSGFGGAIFVADGGTLNIEGNALFANNYVVGGSSENDGEAGQAAGTDLFMMKGSTVTLRPGAGNTIRFEGSIADDSAESIDGSSLSSGDGADIQIAGGGLVQFAGENSYSGTTFISGATLEADIGAGINANSRVTFNGAGTIGASLSNETAGVLLTSGEIVRYVGTTQPHQISWEGSGGFAAGDDGLTLNFGKLPSAPQGQTLYWGTGGFVGNGKTLIFGSEYGTGVVTLVNNVDLKTLQGRIAVYDNENEDADGDWAVLAGKFTNGTLEVNDTGYEGTLYFTNQNSLSGLTLHNGTVSTQLDGKTGRLMHATAGGYLTVTGGLADLYSDEKVTALVIHQPGTANFHAKLDAFSINNWGNLSVDGAVTSGNIWNDGTITIEGSARTGDIWNRGSLEFASDATTLSINNFGDVAVSGSLTADYINNFAGSIVVSNGPTVASHVSNRSGATFQLLGGSTLGHVLNSGDMMLADGASVASMYNTSTGTLRLNGNLTSADTVDNGDGGTIYLAGDITAGSTVTNDGLLVVVGDVVNSGKPNQTENAAVRHINTTGFQDPTGVVQLGGLDGKVVNTLVVNQSGDSLYSGTIIGAGKFEKAGAGTLTLTGANTFTGGLSVSEGGIDTTGGGTFADTLAVTVAQGTHFTVGTADTVRSIANAGSLALNEDVTLATLTNTGTVTTTGTRSINGALVQNAGTVTAGGNLTTGSLSGAGGAIDIGANTLTVNQTANGSYAGSIAGAGTVVKTGSATLTLAGAAGSFAPANLSIQQGTVAVNGAGILDSALTVGISSGASLALVAGNQTIRNLTGTGTVALNGNNLYLAQGGNFAGTTTGTGNIQVTSGTFNLTNAINTSTGAFSVQPNSTINVAASGTVNSQTVNITGSMNVLGTVNSTTNNVNGVLYLGSPSGTGTLVSTNTYVNGGGLLKGVGSITGQIVVGGSTVGTLRPGNSPGIMSVASLTLDNLSVTEMEVEGNAGAGLANGYDRINLTGALTLKAGSTLQIANSNTFELGLGEKIQLFSFTPGKVSGQFGTVTSAFDRKVALNLATGTVVGLGTHTNTSFENAIAHTANETAMVSQVRVGTTGGVNQYYGGRLIEFAASALASGNAANVSAVFAKASPEAYLGVMDHMKLSMLDNRLELGGYEVVDTPTYFMTGEIQYGEARNRDEAGYQRYKSVDRRANLGVAADLPIGRVQASYGYTDGHVESAHFRGEATGNQFTIGASAPVALDGALRLAARFAYGSYDFDGTRVTNAGTAKFGNVGGSSTVFGGGFEYLHTANKFSVDLSVEALNVLNKVDGFTETDVGALEALSVHDQRENFWTLGTKLKLGYDFQPGLRGFVNLSLDQDLEDRVNQVSANVSVENVAMTVANPGFSDTRFSAGMGVRVDLTDSIRWTVQGNVGNASRYGANTSISIRF